MTDTKKKDDDVEAVTEAAVAPDPVPEHLRTYGISGEPLRWAPADWQPVIAAVRRANVAELIAADVQPLLDSTFPGAGYKAVDLVVAGPPKGTFTFSATTRVPFVHKFVSDDAALNLPDSNYTWDFGDGSRSQGSKPVGHEYGRGTYTVTHSVVVSGRIYSSRQTVTALGGAPPTVDRLDPARAVVGAADFTAHVYGTGFVDGKTTVVVADTALPTTFVSATELTVPVHASAPAVAAGTVPVAVIADGQRSNSVGFDYLPALGGGSAQVFAAGEFNPTEHNVDDVVAYAETNPDQVPRLIGEEEVGKARVTLLEKLNAMGD